MFSSFPSFCLPFCLQTHNRFQNLFTMTFSTLITGRLFGLVIRGIQLLFSLIAMALAAAAVDKFLVSDSLRFMVATAVISLVYLIVVLSLALLTVNTLLSGVLLIVDALLTTFWFAAWIAVAATIGKYSCDGGVNYGWGYYYYDKNACGAGKASIAFGAVNWLLFLFTTIVIALNVVRPLTAARKNVFGAEGALGKNTISLDSTPYVENTTKDVESNPTFAEGEHEPKVVDTAVPEIPNDNAATLVVTPTAEQPSTRI